MKQRKLVATALAVLATTTLTTLIATATADASWRPGTATWYGPGFYGNKTACGQRYTKRIRGIANNKYRCGTLVHIKVGRRSVVVPVIDTGGFSHAMDLSARTAMDLCSCTRPDTMRVQYRVVKSGAR